ncbi:MAG TPA: helix-turn-helix domain-containing protein [Candidatus Enterococcus avicola]|uniref:Helix-turn-helix domain-containing protein n=1 Tax=Candidatus Enterococcus avicola TaxID=2838561 RepID=A0A9D2F5X5_9ENTE|nr:helix-turn-helix domain-containing protein [Weissella thailandensis]HIZ52779.1 helix-turn-helix domain-containing protein [Candidatus Enterococcus avicola]HJA22844.1 helix-turn-helix domain-containing protein [Candidatus Limosilactobacillus intestinavium]
MIKRKQWKSNFSQIPNATLRDSNLSNTAFRLLMYMLSMADGWIFRNSKIAKDFGKSERWVQAYLTELEKAGYVQRTAIKNDEGKIVSWERIVYDLPGAQNIHLENIDK